MRVAEGGLEARVVLGVHRAVIAGPTRSALVGARLSGALFFMVLVFFLIN